MMKTGCRLVEYAVASTGKSIGKFCLKMIGDAHETLVESTKSQRDLATHRKITAHKFIYPSRLPRGEMKLSIVRQIFSILPWLDYSPRNQSCSCSFLRPEVSL